MKAARPEKSGFALPPRFFGRDGAPGSMPVWDPLTFIIAAVIIRAAYKELSA